MTRPLLYPEGGLVQHTVALPKTLLAELQAEAQARHVSVAQVIRERLMARHTNDPPHQTP